MRNLRIPRTQNRSVNGAVAKMFAPRSRLGPATFFRRKSRAQSARFPTASRTALRLSQRESPTIPGRRDASILFPGTRASARRGPVPPTALPRQGSPRLKGFNVASMEWPGMTGRRHGWGTSIIRGARLTAPRAFSDSAAPRRHADLTAQRATALSALEAAHSGQFMRGMRRVGRITEVEPLGNAIVANRFGREPAHELLDVLKNR